MPAALTTTLSDIRAAAPCEDGWRALLGHLGKSCTEAKGCTDALPLAVILDANGLDDALWVLDNVVKNRRIISLFSADVAERVLPIFEADRPDDTRPRDAIAVARDADATDEQRAAARDAARDAAQASAWVAARDAACAACAAAWDAAGDVAGDAAAQASAWVAARDAARASAWVAARDAARASAWARLRQYLDHGEAASGMDWPVDAPWPEIKKQAV